MMSKGRAEKLVKLSEFFNLERGMLDESRFQDEFDLLDKGTQMKVLAARIKVCKKCADLNVKRLTECCSGWGNLNAMVMFVGQSLHAPGMVSDIPFVGGSGLLIIAALRLSGLERQDCFWTNILHGHPENNRTSTEREKKNCLPYLQKELDIVRPKLLVLLGADAKDADLRLPEGTKERCFKHPAAVLRNSVPEQVSDFIVKLSIEIDKILEK
jgi:uracil-DNA glycosylase family 4